LEFLEKVSVQTIKHAAGKDAVQERIAAS